MGIEWDTKAGEWKSNGRDEFKDYAYKNALGFQKRVVESSIMSGYATPMDRHVAKNGTDGTNLDHHIPISAIEDMVVHFLNDKVSAWRFLDFVGHVVAPSWLSLTDVVLNHRMTVLQEWGDATLLKVRLAWSRKKMSTKAVTSMANELVTVLNNAQQNLRFGDASTNKSISDALDIREAHGWRFEPFAWVEAVWAHGLGLRVRPLRVLSHETSALINAAYYDHLGARIQPKERNGELAASESDTQIAVTTTKAKNKIYGIPDAVASPLRGPMWPWFSYSPFDRSTVAYIVLGLCFIYFFVFKPVDGPRF